MDEDQGHYANTCPIRQTRQHSQAAHKAMGPPVKKRATAASVYALCVELAKP